MIYFLFISLFLLFLFHFILYSFFSYVFRIESKKIKIFLALILFFLSISFVLSAVIAHRWENIFTRVFYNISGFWYGVLINLIMAIFIYFILVLILRLLSYFLKLNINKRSLGKIFILLALMFSFYGLFNACYPRVNQIAVNIGALPDEWKGKKIVQLSDVHLGRSLGNKFLKNLVDQVNKTNPDIIFITGDLFDGMDGYIATFTDLLDQMEADKGIYYITGNHETYLGVQEVLDVLSKTNIKVLDDDVVNIDGLQVIGVSYPDNNGKDIVNIIKKDDDFKQDVPSILLYHSPTNLMVPKTDNGDWHKNIYWTPDVSFSVARELGVDLQLSGHTHRGQIFPFKFITNFIYGGYDYGLHKIDDFYIYTSSGTGVWGPPMRTGSDSEIVVINLE